MRVSTSGVMRLLTPYAFMVWMGIKLDLPGGGNVNCSFYCIYFSIRVTILSHSRVYFHYESKEKKRF
jgi:hypothetical protein